MHCCWQIAAASEGTGGAAASWNEPVRPAWAATVPVLLLGCYWCKAHHIARACLKRASLPRRFLCFYLILFLVHCNALAMFRMFAALTRDMVVANSVGSCFLVVFLMLSGYIFAQSAHSCSLFETLPVISPSTSLQ